MPEFVDPFAEGEKFVPVKLASVPQETDEQAVRDAFGYSESEKRTKAERDAVAFRITGKKPELDEAKAREKYVSEQVEITRAQFGHDQNLVARLERSRRYAEWRWDGFHTRNDGSRIPFGEPVKPIERQVGSL